MADHPAHIHLCVRLVPVMTPCLAHLERLGIAWELTARKRNRFFSYTGYVEIMNQGNRPRIHSLF